MLPIQSTSPLSLPQGVTPLKAREAVATRLPVAAPEVAGESYVASPLPVEVAAPRAETAHNETPSAPAAPKAEPAAPLSIDGFLIAGAPGANVAARYREEAAARLPKGSADGLLEQAALGLFERDLANAPTVLTVQAPPPPPEIKTGMFPNMQQAFMAQQMQAALGKPAPPPTLTNLTQCSTYTAALAACLSGMQGALTPAVMTALQSFDASKLFNTERNSRYLGNGQETGPAAKVVSDSVLPSGVKLEGAWNPEEAGDIEAAFQKMHTLLPGSAGLVNSVVLRTHIGENLNLQGEAVGQVSGLFRKDQLNTIELSRLTLKLSPESAAETVFHETGHELDRKLSKDGGQRSFDMDTPFGKTTRRADFISDYAMSNCTEDFAETHADLIAHWDEHRANSDIAFYGAGKVSDKRRWILTEGYGLEVPPPSPKWLATLEAANDADSPFGWKTASGERVGAESDMRNALASMLYRHTPASLQQGVQGPDSDKFRWLADKVLGVQVPAASSFVFGDPDDPFAPLPAFNLGAFAPVQDAPVEQTTAPLELALATVARGPAKIHVLRERLQPGPGSEELRKRLDVLQTTFGMATLLDANVTREEVAGVVEGLPLSEKFPRGSGPLSTEERNAAIAELHEIFQARPRILPGGFSMTLPIQHPLLAQVDELENGLESARAKLDGALPYGGGELLDAVRSTLSPELAQAPHVRGTLAPYTAQS